MNTPVSFELAKLLKEKGFDEECRLFVEDGDEGPLPFNCLNTIHRNSLHPYYSAPTIAEVVMWIYEKHGIWIYSRQVRKPVPLPDYWCCIINKDAKLIESVEGYNSPTEAYEAAILYTLNNLI